MFSGAVITEFSTIIRGWGACSFRASIAALFAGARRHDHSIIAVAVAVLIIDLIYPLIDPRVRLG